VGRVSLQNTIHIWTSLADDCSRVVHSESVSGESSTSSSKGEKEGSMEVDEGDEEDAEPTKPSDPNDLSAYNLDNYDEEVSRGTGKSSTKTRSSTAKRPL
jgi:hypothetical protein